MLDNNFSNMYSNLDSEKSSLKKSFVLKYYGKGFNHVDVDHTFPKKSWRNYFRKRAFNNFIKKQYKRFYVHRRNYLPSAKKAYRFNNRFLILFLFCTYFLGFRFTNSYDWLYWRYLVKALLSFNFNKVYKFFLYRSLFSSISYKSNMVQFGLLISIFKCSRKQGIIRIYSLLEKVFINYCLKRYTSMIWFILEYKAKFLVSEFSFLPQFFLIDNNNVNAVFLSRYIAKMLDYNNTLKGVLNPLKREFKYIVKNTRTIPSHFKIKYRNNSFRRSSRSLYRYLLIHLLNVYNKYLVSYFNVESIWFNLDIFMFFMYVYKHSNKISALSKKLFENRMIFSCLSFNCLRVSKLVDFYKVLFMGLSYFVNPLFRCNDFFSCVFIDLFLNKQALFIDPLRKDLSYITKTTRFAFAHICNFFDLQYSMFNYYFLAQTTSINYLKSRTTKYKFASYTGFKIQCWGRFSRRQRSSSYWFSFGTVPLNTATATINYGYYTIPLKNSAITVKTWINSARGGNSFSNPVI